ncbi:hypothetical protein LZ32DRAFT_120197 [Colletotrichum eremochloae]|nr:hypothetical protein LZ32DRAFT_120197 [Colletotrichum eremochloae]
MDDASHSVNSESKQQQDNSTCCSCRVASAICKRSDASETIDQPAAPESSLEPTSVKMTTMRRCRSGAEAIHPPPSKHKLAVMGEEGFWTSRRARRGGELLVLGSPNCAPSSARVCAILYRASLCAVSCSGRRVCVSLSLSFYLGLVVPPDAPPKRLHKVLPPSSPLCTINLRRSSPQQLSIEQPPHAQTNQFKPETKTEIIQNGQGCRCRPW